jgi:nucleotide-binding universal stress UspA family protein
VPAGLPHVLVCVDLSPASEAAVAHAAAVARGFGSRVTLLHVLAPPRSDEHAPTDPFTWEMRREEARDHLRRLGAALSPLGFPVEVDVVEGGAAEQILSFARSREPALVALSSHGEGSVSDCCLGGTARKLVQGLPASVLLVPCPVAGSLPPTPVAYRRILVPLDGSASGESALALAIAIARAHEAEVVLVHAVPAPPLTPAGPPTAEDLDLARRLHLRNERAGRHYLETVAARFEDRSPPVRTALLDAPDPRSALLEAAQTSGADLVVASCQGVGAALGHRLGSVATHLAEHSPLPLLLLRAAPEPRGRGEELPAAPRLPGLELPEEA